MHIPYSALTGLFENVRNPQAPAQPNHVANHLKTRLPTKIQEIPGGVAGTAATIKEMQRLARRAAQDPHWIAWCRTVVADLPSKDYEAEARRIYDVVKKNVRYVLDPRGLELVQDPRYIMFVDGSGDCFAEDVKVERKTDTGSELVSVSEIHEGDQITGRWGFTIVTKVWSKGLLPTWKITIRSGDHVSSVRLTKDHKVWVENASGMFVKRVSELESLSEGTNLIGIESQIVELVSIEKDDLVLSCYDLATEDQYIYLPEADWVVHNCDEHSTLIAAMSLALGHESAFKTVAADPDRPEEFSHVYPMIGIQKGAETWWYPADTTQPQGYFGWEPPKSMIKKEKIWPV